MSRIEIVNHIIANMAKTVERLRAPHMHAIRDYLTSRKGRRINASDGDRLTAYLAERGVTMEHLADGPIMAPLRVVVKPDGRITSTMMVAALYWSDDGGSQHHNVDLAPGTGSTAVADPEWFEKTHTYAFAGAAQEIASIEQVEPHEIAALAERVAAVNEAVAALIAEASIGENRSIWYAACDGLNVDLLNRLPNVRATS